MLGEPPDLVAVDVSFISLKLVLPPALALAAPPAQLVALIKPQFEAGRATLKKGIVRDPAVHAAVCDDIAAFVPSLGWRVLGIMPSPIAGGDGNREFLLGRARMTEQLTIARLGHRGDGVADTDAGPVYVPYTLPGETVTVERIGRPSRPPASRACRRAEPRARRADLPAFRHLRRLRVAALDAGRTTATGSARWSSRRWRRPGSTAPVDALIDAHGEGRRRAVLHARRGGHDMLEVGFAAPRAHQIVAIDRCPILAPALDGAIAGGLGDRRGAQADAASRSTSRSPRPTPASTSTCAAPAR